MTREQLFSVACFLLLASVSCASATSVSGGAKDGQQTGAACEPRLEPGDTTGVALDSGDSRSGIGSPRTRTWSWLRQLAEEEQAIAAAFGDGDDQDAGQPLGSVGIAEIVGVPAAAAPDGRGKCVDLGDTAGSPSGLKNWSPRHEHAAARESAAHTSRNDPARSLASGGLLPSSPAQQRSYSAATWPQSAQGSPGGSVQAAAAAAAAAPGRGTELPSRLLPWPLMQLAGAAAAAMMFFLAGVLVGIPLGEVWQSRRAVPTGERASAAHQAGQECGGSGSGAEGGAGANGLSDEPANGAGIPPCDHGAALVAGEIASPVGAETTSTDVRSGTAPPDSGGTDGTSGSDGSGGSSTAAGVARGSSRAAVKVRHGGVQLHFGVPPASEGPERATVVAAASCEGSIVAAAATSPSPAVKRRRDGPDLLATSGVGVAEKRTGAQAMASPAPPRPQGRALRWPGDLDPRGAESGTKGNGYAEASADGSVIVTSASRGSCGAADSQQEDTATTPARRRRLDCPLVRGCPGETPASAAAAAVTGGPAASEASVVLSATAFAGTGGGSVGERTPCSFAASSTSRAVSAFSAFGDFAATPEGGAGSAGGGVYGTAAALLAEFSSRASRPKDQQALALAAAALVRQQQQQQQDQDAAAATAAAAAAAAQRSPQEEGQELPLQQQQEQQQQHQLRRRLHASGAESRSRGTRPSEQLQQPAPLRSVESTADLIEAASGGCCFAAAVGNGHGEGGPTPTITPHATAARAAAGQPLSAGSSLVQEPAGSSSTIPIPPPGHSEPGSSRPFGEAGPYGPYHPYVQLQQQWQATAQWQGQAPATVPGAFPGAGAPDAAFPGHVLAPPQSSGPWGPLVAFPGAGGAGLGSGALVLPPQAQVQMQMQLAPQMQMSALDKQAIMVLAEAFMEGFNRAHAQSTAQVTSAISQVTDAVQGLHRDVQTVVAGKARKEQRAVAAVAMQRGMVAMWAALVFGSLKWGRVLEVYRRCSVDFATGAAAEAAAAAAWPSPSRWSVLRLAAWGARAAAGGGGGGGGSGGGGSGFAAAAGGLLGGAGWLPTRLRQACCYGQELGLFSLGLAATFYVVLPLLRRTLALDLQRSWLLDVPLLFGGVWAFVGLHVAHSLGGMWTLWLLGWWAWCAAGFALHAAPPGGGGARAAGAAALLAAAAVGVGLLPYAGWARPAHFALEAGWWAARRWLGLRGMWLWADGAGAAVAAAAAGMGDMG